VWQRIFFGIDQAYQYSNLFCFYFKIMPMKRLFLSTLFAVSMIALSAQTNEFLKIRSGKVFKKVLLETNCQNKVGLRTLKKNVIVPCVYDQINMKSKFIEVVENGEIGYFNYKGIEVIPCKFDWVFYDGQHILTGINNEVGLFSANGEMLVPCRYSDIAIMDDIIVAMYNEKKHIYNLSGHLVLE